MSTNRHRVAFWGDKNAMELDGSDGHTTPDILKMLNYILLMGTFLVYPQKNLFERKKLLCTE